METTFRGFSAGERVSFPKQEEEILELWERIQAFENQLKLSEGKPPYTFYDGPPFATGLPHYGHILAGTIKDVVTRYQTQKGHYVERRFGWDCHGVPVEFEIEKKLNIKGRDDVMAMGIDKYNAECRGIVQKYTKEWERTVKRCGRWIDFKNNYKTMDLSFMESVWWVFKTIYNKELVYEGYKVMPYSTALNTPLSNFEAKQNMQDVRDPAVVVSFPCLGDADGAEFLAWTTTPWTLPSNLALCVNPGFTYVKARDCETGRVFIVAEARLTEVWPEKKKKKKKKSQGDSGPQYEILTKMTGQDLVGMRYEPLFQCFGHRAEGGDNFKPNFVVVADTYVTDDAGTGVVHQAPGFGEDDYRVCLREELITNKVIPCPLDHAGRYTEEFPEFQGVYVKEADKPIMKLLRNNGRLVREGYIDHAYPMCWRSDTPLLYRTIPSWFVEVTKIKEDLLACNSQTYWVPPFVKEKRFHNWLADARDWCVSRNRYWGTPLPIWRSDDGEEIVVVGSVAELEELTGAKITDIHREFIDNLTIPSKQGRGDLKRVDEVFDCWFESGSMPYSQQHYPFENAEEFTQKFPADFIAEGLDQTRGWFYTLMVLSTALFNKPAFKNLIVNGLVLAHDGKKMSKSKKNYPPVETILDKYGADAVRVYLMDSPVVRAEPLKFREMGVEAVVRDLFLPWWNAYKFFIESSARFESQGDRFVYSPDELSQINLNIMDRWILSRQQTLIKGFREEMDAYKLYTVIPHLLTFIEELSKGYVRYNKDVLKGFEGAEQARNSLSVLYHVLLNTCQIMAPFTPFLVEAMYQNLKAALVDPLESVHYLPIPDVNDALVDHEIEYRVGQLRTVLNLAHRARDHTPYSLRQPLSKVVVVSPDQNITGTLQQSDIPEYIKSECKLVDVEFSNEMSNWINLQCVPDNRTLGQRLGRKSQGVKKAMRNLDQASIQLLKDGGELSVCGEVVTSADCSAINYLFVGDANQFESAQEGPLLVILDKSMTPELKRKSEANDIRSAVQKLRKAVNLLATDRVWVFYEVGQNSENVNQVVAENGDEIRQRLRAPFLPKDRMPANGCILGSDTKQIGDGDITVYLVQPCARLTAKGREKFGDMAEMLDEYLSTKNYQSMLAKTQEGPLALAVNDSTIELSFEAGDYTIDA